MKKLHYTLRRAPQNNATEWWRAARFATAETGRIAHFQEKSGPLRPAAVFRGMYDDGAILLRCEVGGVSASAEPREYNGWVCRDSCCEFFVQPPRPFGGYVNFEVNAAGVLHASHILDPERRPGGFRLFRYVRPEHGAQVEIRRWRGDEPATPPLPRAGLEEDGSRSWGVALRIPFALLRAYVGPWLEGAPWRANFFTCQENDKARYYASWSPVPVFNFHTPQFFGELRFASPSGTRTPEQTVADDRANKGLQTVAEGRTPKGCQIITGGRRPPKNSTITAS